MVESKSYTAAVKVSTTSISTQTDLTLPIAEDKFKKTKKQKSKSTQVSLDSRNPSNDLNGESIPSKSKTGSSIEN